MAVNSHIMGHGGTTRVAATLVVLLSLLVLNATAFSPARSSVLARRGLLDSADAPRTIAVDLMHAHHVDSPYMRGRRSLTMTERLQTSVANSKRRLQSKHVYTSPVESVTGEYTMEISLGTPTRTFKAIADTGSDLVWLQCANSTCGGANCIQSPDLPFDPSASSTYRPLACNSSACGYLAIQNAELTCPSTNICRYNYVYGDLSFTSGEMASEVLTLTGKDSTTPLATRIPGIWFGCGTDDESTTFNGTDGLVGLGQGKLSLVSQLAGLDIISHAFSYCLVDYFAATTQTSPLLLGSTGTTAKSYTPLLATGSSASHYYVNLVGITVNSQPISYPSDTFAFNSTTGEGGIIVDSGTTVTNLFDAALTPLETAISALVTYPQVNSSGTDLSSFNLCYNTANVSSPVFPTVVFQFENVDVTLGLNNTFVLAKSDVYCFAFTSAGTDGTSIYGNIQQSHFEISFDVGKGQVGFGPGAC